MWGCVRVCTNNTCVGMMIPSPLHPSSQVIHGSIIGDREQIIEASKNMGFLTGYESKVGEGGRREEGGGSGRGRGGGRSGGVVRGAGWPERGRASLSGGGSGGRGRRDYIVYSGGCAGKEAREDWPLRGSEIS